VTGKKDFRHTKKTPKTTEKRGTGKPNDSRRGAGKPSKPKSR
jgi:hypothetical protein